MKGRKPTPTALKILAGNPGQRKLPPNEPQPELGIRKAPSWLCAYARKVWNDDGPGLVAMGVLGRTDWMVFASYCQAAADVRRAREKMQAAGEQLTEVNPVNGLEGRSVYYNIVRERGLDALKYAAELGITPSARTRVSAIPQPDAKSRLAGLFYVEK